ncbi:MAG: hypothetical protein ACRDT4_11170 [Micromonosporaceae bacterium]
MLPPLGRALAWCMRGAIRRKVLLTGGVIAAFGLLVASVWAAHQPPTSPTQVGYVVRVGVAEGQSVSSYAADADRELDALAERGSGEAYALVSFTTYLAPDRFATVLSELAVHRGYTRAVLPDVQTDVVEITIGAMPGDLRTGMVTVADRKATEAESYRRDAAKLTGTSEVEREHRDSYLAKAEAADLEAEAYRQLCSCLYGAVVRAEPRVLDRLAGVGGVRTVDPAPELKDLDHAVFTPPLPDYLDNPGPDASGQPSSSPSGTPPESPSTDPSPSSPTPSLPSPSGSASSGPPSSGDTQSPSADDPEEVVEPGKMDSSEIPAGPAG